METFENACVAITAIVKDEDYIGYRRQRHCTPGAKGEDSTAGTHTKTQIIKSTETFTTNEGRINN